LPAWSLTALLVSRLCPTNSLLAPCQRPGVRRHNRFAIPGQSTSPEAAAREQAAGERKPGSGKGNGLDHAFAQARERAALRAQAERLNKPAPVKPKREPIELM
jgi:hypothetical protein